MSERERLIELCGAACSNAETALNFLASAGRPQLADTQRVYIQNIRSELAALAPPPVTSKKHPELVGERLDAHCPYDETTLRQDVTYPDRAICPVCFTSMLKPTTPARNTSQIGEG